MQKFSVVVESEEQAREAMTLLWDTWGVRGEMELVPLDGHYKLDVVSEQDLSTDQWEQLPGKRV